MSPPTTPQLTTLEPLFPDIQLHILSIAARSPEFLFALVSTCRAWHATYIPLLYETVSLHCGNADDLFYGMGYDLEDDAAPAGDAEEQKEGRGGSDGSGREHLEEGGDEEVRGRGLDSYWDQTPHARLMTRLSLVRRLEILDNLALQRISRLMIRLRGAPANIPPPSPPHETSLFPSCRSVILDEDVLTVVDVDFPRRVLLGQGFFQDEVVLAGGACVDVELHFPKERLQEPSACMGFLVGISRNMGMTVTLCNIFAEELFPFCFDDPGYKIIANLQMPGDEEEEVGKKTQEFWLMCLLEAIQDERSMTLDEPRHRWPNLIISGFKPVADEASPTAAFHQLLQDYGWNPRDETQAWAFTHVEMRGRPVAR